MRDLASVLLVVLAGLALAAAAVFGGGDRSVLVPPPEAAAETFVRELAMARYTLAHQYLARDVQRRTAPSRIAEDFEPLRGQTGEPDQVVTREAFRGDEKARVLATLDGRRGRASLYVDLVREHGLWKVAAWPLDVVGR